MLQPYPLSKLGKLLAEVKKQIIVRPVQLKDKMRKEAKISSRSLPVYLLSLKWRGFLRQPAPKHYCYIHQAQFPSRTCAELANYIATYPEKLFDILQKQSYFELDCGCKIDLSSFKDKLETALKRGKEQIEKREQKRKRYKKSQAKFKETTVEAILFSELVPVIKEAISYIKEASTCDIRKRNISVERE